MAHRAAGGDQDLLSVRDRARLRWRARRGLLENDLIITRFLDRYEAELTQADVEALMQLFEMGDHDLLDVLLGRTELSDTDAVPRLQRLVEQMRVLTL